MRETINFKLNDKPMRLTVDGERMLLWALRSELSLTGTKFGCGEGFCGSCTVLVNKEAVRSCQFPVKAVKEKDVITIERLANNGKLCRRQNSCIKHDALQC